MRASRRCSEFPIVNSSLDASGQNLVLKKYIHLGFAADTPNGLVVPVIRDADKKDVYELARELAALSEKARAGKLSALEMQGASFTVSSLGGIGGTSFTPIINAPEVAILGVARSSMRPVYQDGQFVPRLILPFTLAYDHRVIDGAAGVRFTTFLAAEARRRARACWKPCRDQRHRSRSRRFQGRRSHRRARQARRSSRSSKRR